MSHQQDLIVQIEKNYYFIENNNNKKYTHQLYEKQSLKNIDFLVGMLLIQNHGTYGDLPTTWTNKFSINKNIG